MERIGDEEEEEEENTSSPQAKQGTTPLVKIWQPKESRDDRPHGKRAWRQAHKDPRLAQRPGIKRLACVDVPSISGTINATDREYRKRENAEEKEAEEATSR
eukprot:scaffold764_cov248-Pinguiococcus_pyrenoidosus.AAC.17